MRTLSNNHLTHTWKKISYPINFVPVSKNFFGTFFLHVLYFFMIAALLLQYYDPVPPKKLHYYSPTSYVTVLEFFCPWKSSPWSYNSSFQPQVFPGAFCWAWMTLWCHDWGWFVEKSVHGCTLGGLRRQATTSSKGTMVSMLMEEARTRGGARGWPINRTVGCANGSN